MITFFSTTRPFQNHFKIIQTNAIKSWTKFCPPCEIILFGNEEGTKEIANKLNIQHVPKVESNEYGTPLVRGLFYKAQEIAKYNILCYVNADIVLMNDFLPVIKKVHGSYSQFLISGQRWDLNLNTELNFDELDWEKKLRELTIKQGKLHSPSGLDYFCFTPKFWRDIPEFAIGRVRWDNWLIWKTRQLNIPIIDTSSVVFIVHQNHSRDRSGWGKLEYQRNQMLGSGKLFDLRHATIKLKKEDFI